MEEAEPLVREYSAWALGKIKWQEAEGILKAVLAKESVSAVKNEILRALSGIASEN